MEEIWRPLKNFEGLYEISSHGRIHSLSYNRTGRKKELSPCKDSSGYIVVTLHNKYKKKGVYKVHRLVSETFIPNPENKPQVNHINGIKTDNKVENLEWCTSSENAKHAHKLGLSKFSDYNKQRVKETHQIISNWINEEIRLKFTGNPYDLVRAFPEQKLDPSTLNKIRHKNHKTHKGWRVSDK